MRAKYFLKGMGIGVTVTALIFTIAFALNPPALSDEEVIARAKTLGMIESDETLENQEDIKEEAAGDEQDENGEQDATVEEVTEEKGEEAEDSEDSGEDEGKEVSKEEAWKALKKLQDEQAAKESGDSKNTPDNSEYKTTDTVNDNSAESEATGELKAFSVNNGEDSAVVSSRLYRQGIIDDPNAFDQYLTSHGYDTRIHPGSYNIPSGASYEAIANAITR